MKVKKETAFLGAIGLLMVGMTVALSIASPTPGELSQAHLGLDDEGGMQSCTQCHADEGITSGCLKCHDEIQEQLQTKEGYHHYLVELGHERCESCHGEHYGNEFQLINQHAWQGVDVEDFNHPHTEYELHAAHDSLNCDECHANENFRVLGDRDRSSTMLGLRQECATCHTDIHGSSVASDCASCHDQSQFRPASLFDHESVFALEGVHRDARCKLCHFALDSESTNLNVAADHLKTSELTASRLSFGEVKGNLCQDCHENPHNSPNEAVFGNDCAQCHSPSEFVNHHFDLATHHQGFALEGSHQQATCKSCHAKSHTVLEDLSPTQCAECHDSPHQGMNDRIYGDSCVTCHSPSDFESHHFDLDAHQSFALVGAHQTANCRDCHQQEQRDLQGVAANDCATCHTTPHQASFRESCADCHSPHPTEFVSASLTDLTRAHEQTSFSLAAPHDSLDCAACHSAGGQFQERFPGRNAARCNDCHADPHGNQFGSRGCTDCHASHEFMPSTLDMQTHEPQLLGNHRAVACVACHEKDPNSGVRQFVETPRACAACHENPHGNQFQAEIQETGCNACHTSFEHWGLPNFDHAKTGYPLQGAHTDASCSECHQQGANSGMLTFAGTPRDCRSCHTGHQGQLTGANSHDCSRCHNSMTTWDQNTFDHERHSRFKLTGEHEKVTCAQCHPRRKTADGTEFTYYKPIRVDCRACHDVR